MRTTFLSAALLGLFSLPAVGAAIDSLSPKHYDAARLQGMAAYCKQYSPILWGDRIKALSMKMNSDPETQFSKDSTISKQQLAGYFQAVGRGQGWVAGMAAGGKITEKQSCSYLSSGWPDMLANLGLTL